jgi:hypothetical protein
MADEDNGGLVLRLRIVLAEHTSNLRDLHHVGDEGGRAVGRPHDLTADQLQLFQTIVIRTKIH